MHRFGVVEGCVLKYLCCHVFNCYLFGLKQENRCVLRDIEINFLKHAPAAVAQWRVKTIPPHMLSPELKQHRDNCAPHVAECIGLNLAPLRKEQPGFNEALGIDLLASLVEKAIELHSILRLQLPAYYFVLVEPGAKYDACKMSALVGRCGEDQAAGDGTKGSEEISEGVVEYATSPVLVKHAYNEDKKIWEETIIAKAKVILKDPAAAA